MTESTFITCEYPDNSGFVDTHGWDTVYAVRFPIINEALKKHFSPAGDMAHVLVVSYEDDYLSVHGKFGAWQLTTGGAGNHIFLEIPFAEGTAEFKSTGAVVPLRGISAKVEVTLGFHTLAKKGPSAGTPTDLKIVVGNKALTEAGSERDQTGDDDDLIDEDDNDDDDDDGSNAAVVVHKIIGLDKAGVATVDRQMAALFLGNAIKTWLEKNEQIFDFVFLSVDIADINDKGDFAWIKPTYVGYAVADLIGKSADQSIFAVMAMTEGNSANGVTAEVSARAIPHNKGVNAAFLISPQKFVEKFIKPNIATMFSGGAKASDFATAYSGLRITNVAEVKLPLELDRHYYDQLRSTEMGTIKAGNFSITVDKHLVTTRFESLTFPYGRDDVLSVDVMMNHGNLIGIDENKRFAMKTSGEITRHISVTPDPVKVSSEAWKSFAINMGVTVGLMCMPAAFKGMGKLYGGAKSLFNGAKAGAGALGAGESAAAKGAGLITKEAAVVSETELAQVAKDGLGKTLLKGEAAAMTVDLAATGEVMTINEAVSTTLLEVESVAGEAGQAARGVPVGAIPKRFDMTFLALMTGQLVGGLYGQGTNLATIGAYKQNPEKIPSLVNFGDNCIKHTTWPGSSEATLQCAGLNGAFVMGFNARAGAV